jgi:hypothetical protein
MAKHDEFPLWIDLPKSQRSYTTKQEHEGTRVLLGTSPALARSLMRGHVSLWGGGLSAMKPCRCSPFQAFSSHELLQYLSDVTQA